jgi:tetratricopeptide (TPR) repeat protein
VNDSSRSCAFALLALAACAGQPAAPPAPKAPVAEAKPAPPAPAPDGAVDWLRRAEKLMKLGRSGNPDAYVQAREALGKCVELEPALSECHLLLGEALEMTDDEQGAARSYTQAITHEPSAPHLYAPLAATYLRFKLYAEAEQVLNEGIARVPRELKNAAGILRLYRLLAVVADARGDRAGVLRALEAGAREGGSDPELDFELGTNYASLTPPRRASALQALSRFNQRVCKGAAAVAYKQQCEIAAHVVARLGPEGAAREDAARPAEPTPPVPPKAIASGHLMLPPVPELPKRPLKEGDAFTVWGASYSLRSRAHRQDVVLQGEDRAIAITGYITKTNLAEAPKCSVHPAGRADAPDCRSPIPTFWLGDTKDAPPADCIRVLGWAANFAQIFSAIASFDRKQPAAYSDDIWGVEIPNPLPAVGAKVTVHGSYGTTFTKASTGMDVEPEMGILTYKKLDLLQPAPELATLPGVRRRAQGPATAIGP